MTKIVAAVLVLAGLGAAAVLARDTVERDREYRRLIAQGDAALGRGETFEAVEAYSGAIAMKRDSMLAYLKRGEARQRRGDADAVLAALRDLRTAADLDPTSTRTLERLGDVNLQLGRFGNALDNFEQYLRLDDRTPAVHYKLALAARGAGHISRAIAALERAIGLAPAMHEAHYLLGLCLRSHERHEDARAALERAVALSPAFIAAREELADLYGLQGRDRDEIDQLEALYALDPVKPERLVAVGRAHLRTGQHELAVTTLRRAAERFPEHPGVYEALGEVWLSSAEEREDASDVRKALEALEPIARQSGATSRTLALYGRALYLVGDHARAETVLRQATERFPVEPSAFSAFATVTQRLGRLTDARDALLAYAVLVTDRDLHAENAARLGDLSLEMNDAAAAVDWYRQSVSAVAAPDAALLVRLADAEARAGNLIEARALLSRASALDPELPAARRLSRRLQSR